MTSTMLVFLGALALLVAKSLVEDEKRVGSFKALSKYNKPNIRNLK